MRKQVCQTCQGRGCIPNPKYCKPYPQDGFLAWMVAAMPTVTEPETINCPDCEGRPSNVADTIKLVVNRTPYNLQTELARGILTITEYKPPTQAPPPIPNDLLKDDSPWTAQKASACEHLRNYRLCCHPSYPPEMNMPVCSPDICRERTRPAPAVDRNGVELRVGDKVLTETGQKPVIVAFDKNCEWFTGRHDAGNVLSYPLYGVILYRRAQKGE